MPLNQRFHTTDIVIVGSGFAGSICALILNKMGFKVTLVDQATHPRFAIGESSTPIGNMVLKDLALRYNLESLLPLATYGTWQSSYPHIDRGKKRGFSYFAHTPERPFTPDAVHSNELLVTANTSDDVSDTHWFRRDVDAFLADEVRRAGISLFEHTRIDTIAAASPWSIHCTGIESALSIQADFIIDASGQGILTQLFGHAPNTDLPFRTHSKAIYTHVDNLPLWSTYLAQQGAHVHDHPFRCDDAAVHHLMTDAWLWMLRFDRGTTSVGLVGHLNHPPSAPSAPCAHEDLSSFQDYLALYPSLADLFRSATLAPDPGRVVYTNRLQRLAPQLAGSDWAMLPHSAGFIDPLHSTGIAHSLLGISRLTEMLQRHWNQPARTLSMQQYATSLHTEFMHIDRLVAGCYRALPHFRAFTAYSMLYFASAITFEEEWLNDEQPPHRLFLCAEDPALVQIIESCFDTLEIRSASLSSEASIDAYIDVVQRAIEPYNSAGLFSPRLPNMYEYTATM